MLGAIVLVGGLALGASGPSPSKHGDAMQAWVETAMVKVRPTARPTPTATAELRAARNEYEAFQIAIRPRGGKLSGIRVRVEDFVGPGGARLPADQVVTLYREAYIEVRHPSGPEGSRGFWPDALIPDVDRYAGERRNAFPFDLPARAAGAVWVEVRVPRDARPGDYTAQAVVSAEGVEPVVVPIRLRVWNFEIPSTASLRTAFAAWHVALTRGHYGVDWVDNETQVALVKIYSRALLRHRLSNDTLIYPAPPISDGRIEWSQFDRDWGPFLDGTIEPNGARITAVRVQDYGHEGDPIYYREYQRHFEEKGWLDRLFYYGADEPPPEAFADLARRAHAFRAAARKVPVLVTTALTPTLVGAVDIWTPPINYLEDKPREAARHRSPQRTAYDERLRGSESLWWYQSCMSHGCDPTTDPYFVGWPNYLIDGTPMAHRIMPWLSWAYRVNGELYFHTTYAYEEGDPWANQYYFAGNGDGTFFYPGTPSRIGGRTHIPIESIRLKLVRDGMEDYEYLAALKRLGDGAEADRLARRLVRKTYDWERDPTALISVRDTIAERIEERRGGRP
jgi:hypothetical protein